MVSQNWSVCISCWWLAEVFPSFSRDSTVFSKKLWNINTFYRTRNGKQVTILFVGRAMTTAVVQLFYITACPWQRENLQPIKLNSLCFLLDKWTRIGGIMKIRLKIMKIMKIRIINTWITICTFNFKWKVFFILCLSECWIRGNLPVLLAYISSMKIFILLVPCKAQCPSFSCFDSNVRFLLFAEMQQPNTCLWEAGDSSRVQAGPLRSTSVQRGQSVRKWTSWCTFRGLWCLIISNYVILTVNTARS